ncbi:CAP domain-containing protein [Tautonia plasticadhaerens]|uniref:SCP domain-containing protein n=1 Tax=Tautonia plasticadhaerens TaxID=2527974 RepID=A0A518H4M4_9BACT|nr:CAP domain-containing protein [Tautonia plasticadhaerens]QDV35795.1 hypothetical protein ElP_37030 [Tautonia plasticadhaerens]
MSRTTTRRMPRLEALEARKLLSGDVTGEQQLVLELINEALVAPEAAADRVEQGLSRGALNAIGEDGDTVTQVVAEIAEAAPKAPVAWDPELARAAEVHTEYQIDLGRQTHDGPSGLKTATQRAIAAGYDEPEAVAENIIFGVDSPEQAMTAFLADYGPTNAHDPHRENIQQPDKAEDEGHQDVGVAVLPVEVPVKPANPFGGAGESETRLVVTQVFGRKKDEAAPRLLGVVYDDADADRFYDVGEGVSGASVTITEKGTGTATEVSTWSSGGYQAEVAPGDYRIEVRVGDRLLSRKEARVGGENTKVDFLVGDAPKSSAQVATPSPTKTSTPTKATSSPAKTSTPTPRTAPAPKPTPVVAERPSVTPASGPSTPRPTATSTPAPKPASSPSPSKPKPATDSPAAPPTRPTASIDPTPAPSRPIPAPSTTPIEAPAPRSGSPVESSRAIDRLRNLAARAAASEASGAISMLRSSLSSGNVRSWKVAD